MNSKDLIELAGNPNFISGIYNYCDRWCERCPLTARCLVYAQEKEDEFKEPPETRDVNNAAFWQKLTAIFQQTKEMITSWALENGVDLESEEFKAAGEEHQRDFADAHDHELSVAAENYARQVSHWFEAEPDLPVSDDSGITDGKDSEQEDDIRDATEVIRWYQFQIAVKTVRGLMSRREEQEDDDDTRHDSDGSIKVALIGIDRSISAWRLMQLSMSDRADSIMSLILTLQSMRQNTEHAFPHARDFIRPGFDEASDALLH